MKKRIMSMLLVLVMLLGMVPVLSTDVSAAEDWRRWAQSDSRWKSISLGSSSATIGSHGCAVTAITKLILQSGFRNCDTFNVGILGKWLNSNGGYTSSGGIYFGKPAEMVSGFKFGNYNFEVNKASSSYETQIMNWVKEGYHVLLGVNNNGHYIAVDSAKSLSAGRVYIMDSLKDTSKNADILLTDAYSTVNSYYLYSGYAEGHRPSGNSWTSYQTYLKLSLDINGNLYKEPYNLEENKIGGVSLKKGSEVTAIEVVKNKHGNYWYKIQVSGKEGYIYAGNATVKEYLSDMKVSGLVAPTEITQGKAFTLEANISSGKTIIGDVNVFVSKVENGTRIVLSKGEKVNGHSYSLKGSAIDKAITFNTLESGNYLYILWAQELRYYSDGKELKTYINSPAGSVYAQYGNLLNDSEFKVVKKSTNPSNPSTGGCTITFNTNGGSNDGTTKTYTSGSPIKSFPNTYLRGYIVSGWYTAPYGGEIVDSSTKVNGSMTVYAHWERYFYKITFDPNGGDPLEPVLTDTIEGVNVPRTAKTLIVYNESGATVNTNKYGNEIAVDKNGKIVASRKHGSENKLTVPEGGFVLSGSNEWNDELGKHEGKGWTVDHILFKGYEYVSVDYTTGVVRAYDSYNDYLANEMYVEPITSINELPVAYREGYTFVGWDGIRPGYFAERNQTVYAIWECNHTNLFGSIEENPTCTKEGLYGGTYCENCGEKVLPEEIIPALGHDFGEWSQTIAPTMSEYGEEQRVCLRCGEIETREIPPVDHFHKFTSTVVPPTCIEDGYTIDSCTCGFEYVGNLVPATGHKWDGGKVTKEPTEEAEGEKTFTCTTCGETKTETIAPLGHTHKYTDKVTAPTCTEDGYTTHSCTCGDSYIDSKVAATGHKWDEGKVTKEPTTSAEGEKTFTCTVCKETKIEKIDKLPEEKPDDPKPVDNPFKDVFDDDYYFAPVMWAVEKGVTSGLSADSFGPAAGCTRAQVVTFLWRAAGEPAPKSSENPFKDVKEGVYYYDAVLWAVENGITAGLSADSFGPDANCNRGQIVTFLWRANGKPAPTSSANPFKDVDDGMYYYNAVLWAVENGITAGLSADTFGPDATCTRGQIVTFLYRAYK